MANQSYRAAVIGCGKISRGHANAYQASDRVDLVAGADVFEAAREGFAKEFGLSAMYADAAEMLDAEKPDIVSICTWPPMHADLVELAFSKGVKAVWCEKPMSVSMDDADRMVNAAEAAGGLLVINHQRCYGAAYNQALDLIKEGAIGDLVQITGICAGDALTDGTHLIDMTRYLNGDNPVAAVFGAIDMTPMGDVNPDGMGTVEFNQSRTRYGHHVETSSMAILLFENGVRGHLEMGRISRGGYQRFLIDGTEGRIEVSGDRAWDDGSRVKVRRADGPQETLETSELTNMMEGVLADIVANFETGKPHRLNGAMAREDLKIINSIYTSARTHMIVRAPLDGAGAPIEEMIASGEVAPN
ncbi:MAG TPA: Gfo/Idh/MocA family oxidoreductase [Thermomicrobiales bacterium]|nr:Gfo/Idh/MocA family oxidoreductase [Thermomicrobiales bacterium]